MGESASGSRASGCRCRPASRAGRPCGSRSATRPTWPAIRATASASSGPMRSPSTLPDRRLHAALRSHPRRHRDPTSYGREDGRDPGRPAAGEEPLDLLGLDRSELVDRDEGRDRPALELGRDRPSSIAIAARPSRRRFRTARRRGGSSTTARWRIASAEVEHGPAPESGIEPLAAELRFGHSARRLRSPATSERSFGVSALTNDRPRRPAPGSRACDMRGEAIRVARRAENRRQGEAGAGALHRANRPTAGTASPRPGRTAPTTPRRASSFATVSSTPPFASTSQTVGPRD